MIIRFPLKISNGETGGNVMRAVSKNTIREIIKSKSRFMSILLICAIGVGFFSGVRATCGIKKTSADDYYDVNNLFDLRVVSTFGLTENDAAAIAEIPDVNGASFDLDHFKIRGKSSLLRILFSHFCI